MHRFALALLLVGGCDSVFRLDDIHVPNASPRALVFDNRSSASDLVAFPVLVALSPDVIAYGAIGDPARDLRFFDEVTARDLPFEVEHWDPAGESDVWVLVPRITAGSTSERMLMYYGADAAGTANPAAVWADYDLVFHGEPLVDSSGHSAPMLMAGATGGVPAIAPGVIGRAIAFDGNDGQRVEFMGSDQLFANWPQYTFEVWLEPSYAPDPYDLGTYIDPSGGVHPIEPGVLGVPGGAIEGSRLRNSEVGSASPFVMQTDFSWNGTGPLQGGPGIFYMPNQAWSQITFAYDGQILWFYRDGTALDLYANANPATAAPGVAPLLLGGGTGLHGMIDEVRASRRYRDLDWVVAQYLSMTHHFVTIGDP